jgi:uncharacterized protein (DUF2062 family)
MDKSKNSFEFFKNFFIRIKRYLKYKYLQLFRADGGAAIVATGFSIGLAVEMFTLPTFGLAFFLIFPIAYLMRGSVAAALIGFMFGKLIYPTIFFLNEKVGAWIIPKSFVQQIVFHPNWLSKLIRYEIKLFVGGIVVGVALGLLFYFPVKWILEYYTRKRNEKRRLLRDREPQY